MERKEQENIINQAMDQEFPATRSFNINDKITIIMNNGGPIRSASGGLCGTARISTFGQFVTFYWDDFDESTKEKLRKNFGINESQRPISFSLMKRH